MCCFVQAVVALMEMGFDEKEVIDALRVNNNQQDAAVSHSQRSGCSRLYLESHNENLIPKPDTSSVIMELGANVPGTHVVQRMLKLPSCQILAQRQI